MIEALATLAFDGRRGRFYRAQLLQALKILQSGEVRVAEFKGSWAGAMGHTQFIPTSWAAFAVDWTGDGRRDVWGDDPSDALASTAAYLARSGWRRGQPWGREVVLPRGFDYELTGRGHRRKASDWARMGVRDAKGGAVKGTARAAILAPAGASGPAFMVFPNFDVILRYNNAEAYGLAVGILSDRLAGGGPLTRGWPEGDRDLTPSESVELQRRLMARGLDTGGADGKLGPKTRAAIRAVQRASGAEPDGRASLFLLQRLR